ncbi:MAG: thiamine-phosphate kinase [Planctomycetota bacterium]
MQPGEFGYINWIRDQQRRAAAAEGVRVGPGDDCAVVRGPDNQTDWLLTTDMMLEGSHFDLATAPPDAVGYKLLAVSVSDIAAMGGVPMFALTSVGFPHAPDEALREGLYRGLERAAAAFGVSLVGGDVTAFRSATAPLVLSLALTGRMDDGVAPVLRSGAKPGQLVYVTGALGGSLASGRHLSFVPRVAEGRWLAARGLATSMLDISDGLAGDVAHICEESGVGVVITASRLPVHNGVTLHQALTDGEDFELLFTVDPARADELERSWPFGPAVGLSRIGHITDTPADRWLEQADGTREPLPVGAAFDHLR